LPRLTTCWAAKDGYIRPIPYTPAAYEIQFLQGLVGNHRVPVFRSIRWALTQMARDLLANGYQLITMIPHSAPKAAEAIRQATPYFQALETLVMAENDQHFENFTTLALFREAIGDLDVAESLLGKALDCIHSDSEIDPTKGVWPAEVNQIECSMRRIREKISVVRSDDPKE
ncbi:hypothetical protein JXA47_15910, partial [Candidatus Sumerlaeota bacterium]|nr:hypothetical protein [Candidatus Sumerlaeota bacterium]